MLEALCRSSGSTLDIRMSRDGPPITQRTSGLKAGGYFGGPKTFALYEATYFAGLRKAGMLEK